MNNKIAGIIMLLVLIFILTATAKFLPMPLRIIIGALGITFMIFFDQMSKIPIKPKKKKVKATSKQKPVIPPVGVAEAKDMLAEEEE